MTATLPSRITLARVGVLDATSAGIPLNAPDSAVWRGDTLSLKGDTDPNQAGIDGDIVLARILRQQLQGLASVAGQVRPFTSGDFPEFNGFYRYGTIVIEAPRNDPGMTHGSFGWSLDLERVPGYQLPLVQSRIQGALRTKPDGTANAHGISTANTLAWHAPGAGAYGYQPAAPSDYFRIGADGQILFEQDASETLFDASPKWMVSAEDYYRAASQIVYSPFGSVLASPSYVVVGDQMPNVPNRWAMFNSLVAVTSSVTAAKTEFSMLFHDGNAYESLKTFRITRGAVSDSPYEATQVRILRNAPECASLRVNYWPADADYGVGSIDFTLRRGSRFVEVLLHIPPDGGSDTFGVKLVTPDAGTDHTSGIHATSNDAGGNRWVMSSPQAVTTDTTNGAMRLTSGSTKFAFMVGAAMGDQNTPDSFTDLVYQYFAAQTERQRVVVP